MNKFKKMRLQVVTLLGLRKQSASTMTAVIHTIRFYRTIKKTLMRGICEVLSAESMKPSKMKRNLDTKYFVFKDKPVESFFSKKSVIPSKATGKLYRSY